MNLLSEQIVPELYDQHQTILNENNSKLSKKINLSELLDGVFVFTLQFVGAPITKFKNKVTVRTI